MAFIETRTMRYALLFITLLCAAAVGTVGCTKDDLEAMPEPTAPGETRFQLAVASYEVKASARAAEPSPVPEPESDEEKAIRDFWLFQFNTDGSQLVAPKYYALKNYTGGMSAMLNAAFQALTKNTPMTIYIVTNTGSSTWATQTPTDFDTLDKVKAQKLPSPYPIRILADPKQTDAVVIPMSGQLENVTVANDSFVVVPVTRMYAKVKIRADFEVPGMTVYDVDVTDIPWYCRVAPVGTLDANGEPQAVPIPEGTTMISRAFSSSDAVTTDADGTKWLVLYMPENIRGEIADADKKGGINIPEKSLEVHIRAKYSGMNYNFTVYPGENTKNNFNVRRNCVYRVAVDVKKIEDLHTPSSNCFIIKPGEKLVFEPYNRVEHGGGYDIETYLNPTDPDKKIATVEIIWQTLDCIGDNTGGNLVKYELNADEPQYSKIIVEPDATISKPGNALVGARNANKEIVWSWHIWVTPHEPDNLSKAIVYKTYEWDSNNIYPNRPRVPGYSVMSCNLGALADRANKEGTSYSDKFSDNQKNTFGMLYQWGRKDPFPPLIKRAFYTPTSMGYNDDTTGPHYGNNNRTKVGKTDATTASLLFHSEQVSAGAVKFSIANPTVYCSMTTDDEMDWCPKGESDNKLWGALDPGLPGQKCLYIGTDASRNAAHLYDNYGTEKSIFDPCPSGWRVPPGELWLGFTKTGKNPSRRSDINYNSDESDGRYGMSMYMQDWQGGPTSYFPTQGTRRYSGQGFNPGICGNYHNATCDMGNRVNILHIHDDVNLFHIFELMFGWYYVKSTAGPIRCVRDSK